jgi:hypothetical protein
MVRHFSEMMILTSKGIPDAVSDYLREAAPQVDRKGNVKSRTQFSPVLDRYSVLLKYGFDLEIDRGAALWQRLEAAKNLRDYYTHVDASESRSISSDQVLEFLESVLIGIIWPSSLAQRSVMLGAVNSYWIWAELGDLTAAHLPSGHVEEPFFHSWQWEGKLFGFYCPFTSVDEQRFPNSQEWQRERLPTD